MGDKKKDFPVKYDSNCYDIKEFLKNHPGGVNYVQPYYDKDVSKTMLMHDHSKAAYYLMKEYKIGGRDPEDLEKLVDWNKPMLSQVGNLGAKYHDWVTSPVDRQLRLFGNPILEYLTITPWYLVPIVWIPVIIYICITGTQKYLRTNPGSTFDVTIVLSFIGGVFLWSLLEYSLHRWLFHIVPSGRSKIAIYCHFAIHGLHHKAPFDARRLVFPPFPAAVLTYVLFQFFALFLPDSTSWLIMAGAISGYLAYDMTHFYLHHGSPAKDTYFYHLKRYHNQHHFAHQNSAFGISSVFWDDIFNTGVPLKELNMSIKW